MRRLAIDVGEMTGWALAEDGRKFAGGQMPGRIFNDALAMGLGVQRIEAASAEETPQTIWWTGSAPEGPFQDLDVVIMEDFTLYPWETHTGNMDWSTLETVRILGGIETICTLAQVPLIEQGANIKQAAKAAGAEDDFVRPLHANRHENDATMHLTYDWALRKAGKR